MRVQSIHVLKVHDIMEASFKDIRRTPQYMLNMRSDKMSKNRNLNVYTFFVQLLLQKYIGLNFLRP